MSNKVNKPVLYFSPASIIPLTLNERYVCITVPHSTPYFQCVLECLSYGVVLSVCMQNVSCPLHLKNKLKQVSFFILIFCLKSAKLSGSIFNIPCQCSGCLAMHLKLGCWCLQDVHPTGSFLFAVVEEKHVRWDAHKPPLPWYINVFLWQVCFFLLQDYNDEIRQEQLRELSYLNGSDDPSRGRTARGRGLRLTSTASTRYSRFTSPPLWRIMETLKE